MALDDDSDLFDPPARPKQPSNKIIYQPPGAQWSLSRLPEVESLYRSLFNKQLPLANKGQGSIHNKWGYDHRNSADVSINPSTPEGQQFTEQLRKANIPFLAFTSAIPGVATGPHIHIGFPSQRTQQKFNVGAQKKSTTVASDDLFDSPQSPQSQQASQTDDDLFDSSEQSTPRTSAETKSTPPRATAASALANSLVLPRGRRNRGPLSRATFSGKPPSAEDVLTDIGNQTTAATDWLTQQAQGGAGVGELRRLDDPEARRITRIQQQAAAQDPASAKLLPARLARRAAQQASQERGDELQVQANEPQLRELTNIYRQKIREAKGMGIGPEQWLNEAAAKGAAGLTELAAGAFRGASPALALTSRVLRDPNRADIIALHAQAMQRAAEEEGADRNRVSKAIQNVIGGTISSAPEMGTMALGAPPMAAFGAGGATRALGEGKRPVDVARAAAHGVATGGAFELPLPQIANPLTRAATRAGVTGLATGGLESQTGAPLGQSIEAGLTNALLSGAGELVHQQAPSSLERGLAREPVRERVEPDAVIAARLRGDKPANERVTNEPQIQTESPVEAQRAQVESGTATPQVGTSGVDLQKPPALVPAETGTADIQLSAEPAQPQRFFHRDYGEVTESPNQKQVGKGRVRVIDEDGREHVIKRAAMTGAGNQRAVPIRESTAQPATEPAPTTATESQLTTPKEVTDVTQEATLAPESQKPTSSIASKNVGEAADVNTASSAASPWEVPREPLSAKPATEPVTETAVKNASMAADRAARDLPELAQAEPRKATEVHQRAIDANAKDPRSVDRLVQQALESDKNLTDVETAQLRLRAQEIKNREQELLREIDSATDPQTIREKRVELDSLTNEFDRLSQATKKAGTEWGRAGVARQQAINEDYSLVAMRARMKAAKGSELSEKENVDVENLHKRISDLEAQVAEANQRAEAKISAESVNKFIREHKLSVRKQARARTREGLQAERSDLKQQIAEAWAKQKPKSSTLSMTGLGDLDPEGVLTKLIGKLARNYIEDGVTRASDLVDAVHAHISDVADLTKREVSDLISGYGVIRKPSVDPVERKLNELKSILASQSGKADVVEQGIRPLRRGQQREKPTEDQRRALRELQDAMAQHPEISRGRPSEVEQQTPLDKAKTTTRNRIEQLKSWIESGKKEVQGQARVIPDAELIQLKAERDALQKVADLLDDPKADQRAVERRVSELSKSIAETRQRIQSGQVGPRVREGASQRWTPEIGQLEKERATLRQIAADMRKQPKTPEPKASFYGATGSWAEYEAQARKTLAAQKAQAKRITIQIAEYERRAAASDFGPRPKRTPIPSTPELDAARESLARAKNQFLRKEREFKRSQRGSIEKLADFWIQFGRAAKLSYISTLGKLTGAATGRMVMSPIENLVGEIPHRLSPELSRRATVEGGGFDRAAEVAALWKSGRFKQMLNQITKGSSDLDVLYGGQKGIDKEMSSEGVLGYPGRVHGALKEYPRQAEKDRAFIKVLRNYERAGKDITDPNVQLAAHMESYVSADRARFQQRNFISDEFNNAMNRWERRGGLAKGAAKIGRFVFPITRVPVNVAGETLNYTLGIPRAAIETAIRGGVSKLTPEQANNIMRAYKKGGVGLAIMAYAYFHPQQFGGYYQKGDRRGENEPAPGEVMFFGHRIPKWATHIPIIEAGQLAATVRRVSDKLREQGEDKSEATLGGVTAGAKGVASGIPFYETPARFFTGQEGARGWAEVVGQQGKGMIPGFVQEGAQLMDKDAQGKPIKRKPSGTFAQRVGQTVELGLPGLRSRVPLNDRAYKSDRKAELIEKFRNGEISKSDLATEDLTPAERSAVSRIGKQTERQARFSNFPAATALDRFERMDPAHQEEVREQMEKKAWNLTHSDTLTEQQKADFQERLDKLGITPREPKKSSGSFKDLFRQSASPF